MDKVVDINFNKSLEIDKFALDEEWLKQASLYFQWSLIYSQALMERDRNKQKLELVKAELESQIRANPERFNLKKGTEGEISSSILLQDEYKEALEIYQKSVYDLNIISSAIEALNHKKTALDNLTKLFLSGYYSKNVVSKESETFIEKDVRIEIEKSLKNPDDGNISRKKLNKR
jgi:hypothetical protein